MFILFMLQSNLSYTRFRNEDQIIFWNYPQVMQFSKQKIINIFQVQALFSLIIFLNHLTDNILVYFLTLKQSSCKLFIIL